MQVGAEEAMDDARFDDWTRRRFGLVAGGGLLALLVAGHPADAAGRNRKRKRKRKRKRRRQQKPTCPGAGRPCDETDPDCCPGLACEWLALDAVEPACCYPDGAECTPETPCCSSNCDAETGTCATCRGRACGPDDPCCALLECEDGFCGGCVERGAACSAVVPCCPGAGECVDVGPFSLCGGCLRHPTGIPQCFLGDEQIPCCETDCTGGACLSAQGRPCEFDKDCLACDEDFDKCPGACAPNTKTCTV
jgi:hypothetical protein